MREVGQAKARVNCANDIVSGKNGRERERERERLPHNAPVILSCAPHVTALTMQSPIFLKPGDAARPPVRRRDYYGTQHSFCITKRNANGDRRGETDNITG
jgi:hypothetical protein